MSNCMLDLETVGTAPGCAILSIGAVLFHRNGIGAEFYTTIDLQTCVEAGLSIDPDTVMWWLGQPEEARDHIRAPVKRPLPLRIALHEFTVWLGRGVRVWGNGASFDQPILAAAFAASGLPVPWKYHDAMCYRTIRAVFPHKKVAPKIAHHALYDARAQAETLVQIANDYPDAEIL